MSKFGRISSPLNDKLQKDEPFKFFLNEKKTNELKSLQQKLISLMILALLCAVRRMKLDAGGCPVTVGCVFLREQSDRVTKPIGYWSCSPGWMRTWYIAYMIQCLENFSQLWEVLALRRNHDCTRLRIRTDHDLSGYGIYRISLEVFHDSVHGYPNSRSMSFTEPS